MFNDIYVLLKYRIVYLCCIICSLYIRNINFDFSPAYTYFAAFFTSDGMQPPGTQVIVVKEEEGKHHYFSPPIYHLRALT